MDQIYTRIGKGSPLTDLELDTDLLRFRTAINGFIASYDPLPAILPPSRGGTGSNLTLVGNRVIVSTSSGMIEHSAITPSMALISSGAGLPIASSISGTKLGYLTDVTSNIQAQIDSKAANFTILPISRGGTETNDVPTDGQLLIGNGTNYTLAALTAGSNISITNNSGAITIAATSGIGSINGLTGNITIVPGSAGTDFGITSIGTQITLNIPSSSTLNRGLLTSTDWNTFNGKLTSPMTTLGDIIMGGAAGAAIRLGIGTSSQMLRVNSGATALEYFSPTFAISPLTTKGDLWGYTTTNARVPVGSNNQFLTANSSESAGLEWRNITITDIPYFLRLDGDANFDSFARVFDGISSDLALVNADSTYGMAIRIPLDGIDDGFYINKTVSGSNTEGRIWTDLDIQGLGGIVQGDIWYGSAANTVSKLAKNTSATRYLSNAGTSNNPAWTQIDLTNGVTGVLPPANGGTGASAAFTLGSIPYSDGTKLVQSNANLFFNSTKNAVGIGSNTFGTNLYGLKVSTTTTGANISVGSFTGNLTNSVGITVSNTHVQGSSAIGWAASADIDPISSSFFIRKYNNNFPTTSLRNVVDIHQFAGAGIRILTDNTERIYIGAAGNVGIANSTPDSNELLTLGTPGTKAGIMSLAGSAGGRIVLRAAATTSTYTWTFPSDDGTANFVLSTNGLGTTSWISPTVAASPLTTKGDLWVYSNTNTRLPVGANDQLLVANSGETTGLLWRNLNAGDVPFFLKLSDDADFNGSYASVLIGTEATIALYGATGPTNGLQITAPFGDNTTFNITKRISGTDHTGRIWTDLDTLPSQVASPANSVQYNNGGVFGGSSNFVWEDSFNRLNIGNSTSSSDGIIIVGGSGTGTGRVTGGGGALIIEGGDLTISSNPTHLINVKTNNTTRLTFSNSGEWLMAGSNAGSAGQFIRSSGSAAIPTWSTTIFPNSATTGDIMYASASNIYSNLAGIATGNALISGGISTAPSWGKIGLTTHVTGTLGVGNGGTGTSTTFTTGSVVYAGASGVYSQDNATFFYNSATGSLGLGTSSVTGRLNLVNTGTGDRGLFIDNYAGAASTVWRRANGTTGSPTQVVANDAIGFFGFRGYHSGGAFPISSNAFIQVMAAENFTSGAQGTFMQFATTPTGSTTSAIYMTILGNGNVGIRNVSPANILQIGTSGTIGGTIGMAGLTSGTVVIATASAAGSWTLTMPTSGGTNGYPMITNGSGTASWSQLSLTAGVTGILPYANGGTNASTSWTPGSIIFAGASAFAQANSNLFYDASNVILGIGTNTFNGENGIRVNLGSGSVAYSQIIGNNATAAGLWLSNISSSTSKQTSIFFADGDLTSNLAVIRVNGGSNVSQPGAMLIGTSTTGSVLLQVNGNTAANLASTTVSLPYAAPASANNAALQIGPGNFTSGTGVFSGSASGTVFGLNAASGFGGNLLDLQLQGVTRFNVSQNGSIQTIQPSANGAGRMKIGKIITGVVTGFDATTWLELEIDGVIFQVLRKA